MHYHCGAAGGGETAARIGIEPYQGPIRGHRGGDAIDHEDHYDASTQLLEHGNLEDFDSDASTVCYAGYGFGRVAMRRPQGLR